MQDIEWVSHTQPRSLGDLFELFLLLESFQILLGRPFALLLPAFCLCSMLLREILLPCSDIKENLAHALRTFILRQMRRRTRVHGRKLPCASVEFRLEARKTRFCRGSGRGQRRVEIREGRVDTLRNSSVLERGVVGDRRGFSCSCLGGRFRGGYCRRRCRRGLCGFWGHERVCPCRFLGLGVVEVIRVELRGENGLPSRRSSYRCRFRWRFG